MNSIKRALISVSDKTDILPFAKALTAQNIEIISTGGTYKLLQENGIDVIEISKYTDFPEIMDGRVKTLHPKVHGGILKRYNVDEEVMKKHNIDPIDLVVVNLYPFKQTVAKADVTLEEAIENIDIGGPTMIRAAAKNYQHTYVITDSTDYNWFIEQLNSNSLTIEDRFYLAKKAFQMTASYDSAIITYLSSIEFQNNHIVKKEFSDVLFEELSIKQVLRYGENPHQKAAFYQSNKPIGASIASAKQLQGKELSYNNIADSDAALECVQTFLEPACVIVKHANPCGVAIGANIQQAYLKAYETDKESAFGGIIAFNRQLDAQTAQEIISKQFVEVIIAPNVQSDALQILATKPNIRLLVTTQQTNTKADWNFKHVNGGMLLQQVDDKIVTEQDLKVVTTKIPTAQEIQDLLFAWKVVKFVKSNAIVFAKNEQTLGVGAGQMSRVNSTRIAIEKAKQAELSLTNSVLASDAFFPFKDSLLEAINAGISAIIQPGGSIRDNEVIDAANKAGISMVFTNIRHFRH